MTHERSINKEIGIIGDGNKTYVSSNKLKEEIIDENAEIFKRLKAIVSDKDLSLPSMYWLPKKHKTPTGTRFIIASKPVSYTHLTLPTILLV